MSRNDWLAVRKTGIGSSDAAAAVGLNPYKSQLELWLEKTGRDTLLPNIDPLDEESPTYWGNILEPIVATHYTQRTGNRVRRINAVLQHSDPQLEWMLANIDREVIGTNEVQILECKTAGINGARLWKEGVPVCVQLQVMHQLTVTGKQAADGRLNVVIGDEDALGSFVFRTTGFNSIRTLAARLQYLQAISGNRLACLALELRLRGKSTRQSHGSPIFYVDITVRSGVAREVALQQARELDELRQASGFDQTALDATARLGFANGAFEDSEDEGSAIVDEFFPESATDTPASPESQPVEAQPALSDKLRPTLSTPLRERAEARTSSTN